VADVTDIETLTDEERGWLGLLRKVAADVQAAALDKLLRIIDRQADTLARLRAVRERLASLGDDGVSRSILRLLDEALTGAPPSDERAKGLHVVSATERAVLDACSELKIAVNEFGPPSRMRKPVILSATSGLADAEFARRAVKP
jgi:hypothetical protein